MAVIIFLVVVFQLIAGYTSGLILTDSDPLTVRMENLEYKMMQVVFNNTRLQHRVDSLQNAVAECNCQATAHPAFMAKIGSSNFNCVRNQTLVFDSTDLDSEYPYSHTQGVFTAPVSGSYAFNVALSTAPGDKFHIVLVKNRPSNIIGYLFSEETGAWEKDSTTVVTHLDKGDTVWVKCTDTSRITGHLGHWDQGSGDYHSHFSGFLIASD